MAVWITHAVVGGQVREPGGVCCLCCVMLRCHHLMGLQRGQWTVVSVVKSNAERSEAEKAHHITHLPTYLPMSPVPREQMNEMMILLALGHFGGDARRLPSGLVVPVVQGIEFSVYGQRQVHHFRPWADVLPGIHALVSLCRRRTWV